MRGALESKGRAGAEVCAVSPAQIQPLGFELAFAGQQSKMSYYNHGRSPKVSKKAEVDEQKILRLVHADLRTTKSSE